MYRHIEYCLQLTTYNILKHLSMALLLWICTHNPLDGNFWPWKHENNGSCIENNRYISWELAIGEILRIWDSIIRQNMRIIYLTPTITNINGPLGFWAYLISPLVPGSTVEVAGPPRATLYWRGPIRPKQLSAIALLAPILKFHCMYAN